MSTIHHRGTEIHSAVHARNQTVLSAFATAIRDVPTCHPERESRDLGGRGNQYS